MDLTSISQQDLKDLLDAIGPWLPSSADVSRSTDLHYNTVNRTRNGLAKNPVVVQAFLDMAKPGWQSAVPDKYKSMILQPVNA